MLDLRKVQSGERFRMPADVYNALLGLLADAPLQKPGPAQRPSASTTHLILNDRIEETDVEQFEVLGIDGVLVTPDENETEFKGRVVLKGVTPVADDHAGNFVVALEPIAYGKIGRCVVQGMVPVKMTILEDCHGFAEVLQDGGLTSAQAGAAQILWKEDVGEDKWAWIRIGEAPPSTPFPAKITGGGVGAYTWEEVDSHGAAVLNPRTSVELGTAHGMNEGLAGYEEEELPVNFIVTLFAIRNAGEDVEDMVFILGGGAGGGETSEWGLITGVVSAGVYEFTSESASSIALEVNCNENVSPGTVVRVFGDFEDEEDFAFEYAAGGVPSDTVEEETNWGIAPAAGSEATYARGDHTHGTPEEPVIPQPEDNVEEETNWGIAPAAGAAATYSRGDHTHGTPEEPDTGDVPIDAGDGIEVTGGGEENWRIAAVPDSDMGIQVGESGIGIKLGIGLDFDEGGSVYVLADGDEGHDVGGSGLSISENGVRLSQPAPDTPLCITYVSCVDFVHSCSTTRVLTIDFTCNGDGRVVCWCDE